MIAEVFTPYIIHFDTSKPDTTMNLHIFFLPVEIKSFLDSNRGESTGNFGQRNSLNIFCMSMSNSSNLPVSS